MANTQKLLTGRSSQFADSGGVVPATANTQGIVSYADITLWKNFFSTKGYLFANTIQESAYDIPTFSALSAGSVSYKEGSAKFASGGARQYLSYDLGANYTKTLFITGGVCPFNGMNNGVFACKTLDGSNAPTDGTIFLNEANSSATTMYTLPGFSAIGSPDLGIYAPIGSDKPGDSYAMVYLPLTNRAIGFRKRGNQFGTILDVTDAAKITLTLIRHVGFYMQDAWLFGPIGIYAE
jgi:hypothetical protein